MPILLVDSWSKLKVRIIAASLIKLKTEWFLFGTFLLVIGFYLCITSVILSYHLNQRLFLIKL